MRSRGSSSYEAARAEVAGRLRHRQDEIESEILTQLRNLADRTIMEEAEFAAAMPLVVASALEHALEAIAQGPDWVGPAPLATIAQATRAARLGFSLADGLRRYVLGHTRLWAFVVEEVEKALLPPEVRIRLLQEISAALGLFQSQLVAAVTETHLLETGRTSASRGQRREKQVMALLTGLQIAETDLEYDLTGTHVGLIATGPRAYDAVKQLAGARDASFLIVTRGDSEVMAWLRCARPLTTDDVERALLSRGDDSTRLAAGEPQSGLPGFRLTHRQAQAANAVILRSDRRVARYADVGLLALALGDEEIAKSFANAYLATLRDENQTGRSGTSQLRETLSVYLEKRGNVVSAAAALGVDRRTVYNRIERIEEVLGFPINSRRVELEVALRLDELFGASEEHPNRRANDDDLVRLAATTS